MVQQEQLSMFEGAATSPSESSDCLRAGGALNSLLIETALPSRTISAQGTAERYSHGKTPHSMHVWWARRPLSSMRALVFASLARVASEEDLQDSFDLCAALARFQPLPLRAIKRARQVLGDGRVVLDLFGGGGSIAFEAARLGCKAISVELNPLAVFVQRTLLNYSQSAEELPRKVSRYGLRLLNRLYSDTAPLFPYRSNGGETVAYFWARGAPCPNQGCAAVLPVTPMILLRSRNGSRTCAVFAAGKDEGSFEIRTSKAERSRYPDKADRLARCPFCGRILEKDDLRMRNGTFSYIPAARCVVGREGKFYAPYRGEDLPLSTLIEQELSAIGGVLPSTELPRWSGITNPTVYGIVKHRDLFSPRQLFVLLALIRNLRVLYQEIAAEDGLETARSVVACLSGLIDQLVDWNSSFSIWLATNEQVGRSLAGPGMPMQWTFAEIDPCSRGPANLWDKLERIVHACELIPRFVHEPIVLSGTATRLDLPDSSVDAIVTDPPYADNMYYSVLSDCIYTWKRLCLHDVFPKDFALPGAPTEEEIVASSRRQGDSDRAMDFYSRNLRAALSEGYRVLKPGGVLSLIFTHSTLDGWSAVFSAVVGAGFTVAACWPFCIERKARPRGLTNGAVHASAVIVATKTDVASTRRSLDQEEQEARLSALQSVLLEDGWSPMEIGLALFVQRTGWQLREDLGTAELHDGTKVRSIVEACYKRTREIIPEFSLKSRRSL